MIVTPQRLFEAADTLNAVASEHPSPRTRSILHQAAAEMKATGQRMDFMPGRKKIDADTADPNAERCAICGEPERDDHLLKGLALQGEGLQRFAVECRSRQLAEAAERS